MEKIKNESPAVQKRTAGRRFCEPILLLIYRLSATGDFVLKSIVLGRLRHCLPCLDDKHCYCKCNDCHEDERQHRNRQLPKSFFHFFLLSKKQLLLNIIMYYSKLRQKKQAISINWLQNIVSKHYFYGKIYYLLNKICN